MIVDRRLSDSSPSNLYTLAVPARAAAAAFAAVGQAVCWLPGLMVSHQPQACISDDLIAGIVSLRYQEHTADERTGNEDGRPWHILHGLGGNDSHVVQPPAPCWNAAGIAD